MCKTEDELREAMREQAEIAIFLGANPDRLRAIEKAGNEVAREKGWNECYEITVS
jgi:hypothetical protein